MCYFTQQNEYEHRLRDSSEQVLTRPQVQNHRVQEGSAGEKPDPCSHSRPEQQAPLISLPNPTIALS